MMLRRQLAAYSPVSASGIARAVSQLVRFGDDPRAQLRRYIERDYNAPSVTLVGSGTQALSVALRKALERGNPNAPVALPAFSCFDLASAVAGAGANVIFYDIARDTLTADPVSLEHALAAGARVVVASPLYGIPQDWQVMTTLANSYGAVLVQDAAQGGGATLNGEQLGTLGEMSTLSFGRAKGWTGGNGGALLERGGSMSRIDQFDEPGLGGELTDIAAMMAHYAFGRPYGYALPTAIPSLRLGQTTYRAPKSERSISRASAAALLATREAAAKEADIRKSTAKLFLERIRECSNVQTISIPANGIAGFLRLPLILPEGMASFRSQDRARMLGIAPTYPAILPRLPQIAKRRIDSSTLFPGASSLVTQLITLPTHSLVSLRDVDAISRLLRMI
jgi:dTDP-4-amino-4,6-dideoxygalactose transaminase